jgi:hypothetical protein
MPNFIQQYLRQAENQGSKSTVITPIGWLLAILLSGTTAALKYNAPTWVLIVLMLGLGILFAVFAWAFVFFSYRSPDYLRSERYTLTKLAIEHSQKGDNLVGLIDVALQEPQQQPRLPPSPNQENGGK